MTWKSLIFHVARLAFAGMLLWLDTRFFLFYACTLLLGLAFSVNRLRATLRWWQIANEMKLMALLRTSNLPSSFGDQMADEMRDSLTDKEWRQLGIDYYMANGRGFITGAMLRAWEAENNPMIGSAARV